MACWTEKDVEKSEDIAKHRRRWVLIAGISFAVVFIVIILVMCGYVVSLLTQLPQNTADQKPHFNQPEALGPIEVVEEQVTPKPIPESNGVTVLRHPDNQNVKSGDPVTMRCQFSQKVHCMWLRRSTTVEISGRYKYDKPQLDDWSTDCSFTIQSFQQLDIGEWQCVGVLNDDSSKATKTAKLALPRSEETPVSSLVDSPTDQRVDSGDTVTLQCRFNSPVECVWMRRGEHIDVMGRYGYVTPADDADGKRSDCSVIISNVKQIDVGQWVCGSMADSDSTGVTSKPFTITLNSR